MITRGWRHAVTAAAVAVLLTVSACSSGDDEGTPGAETTSGADGGGAATLTTDGLILPEVEEGDNITTQLLVRLFGLPGSFVTADQSACMSDELAPLFPGGDVPEDITLTEELIDAINDAADGCGVTDFGS